jgi:hypothetical protein
MKFGYIGYMYWLNPKASLLDQIMNCIQLAKNKLQIMPDTIILPMSYAEINLKIDGFTLIYEKYSQPGHCWIGNWYAE